jgi:hypothetical protein
LKCYILWLIFNENLFIYWYFYSLYFLFIHILFICLYFILLFSPLYILQWVAWNQCVTLDPHPKYLLYLFWDGVLLVSPGWPHTYHPPFLTSVDVGSIGVFYQNRLIIIHPSVYTCVFWHSYLILQFLEKWLLNSFWEND